MFSNDIQFDMVMVVPRKRNDANSDIFGSSEYASFHPFNEIFVPYRFHDPHIVSHDALLVQYLENCSVKKYEIWHF